MHRSKKDANPKKADKHPRGGASAHAQGRRTKWVHYSKNYGPIFLLLISIGIATDPDYLLQYFFSLLRTRVHLVFNAAATVLHLLYTLVRMLEANAWGKKMRADVALLLHFAYAVGGFFLLSVQFVMMLITLAKYSATDIVFLMLSVEMGRIRNIIKKGEDFLKGLEFPAPGEDKARKGAPDVETRQASGAGAQEADKGNECSELETVFFLATAAMFALAVSKTGWNAYASGKLSLLMGPLTTRAAMVVGLKLLVEKTESLVAGRRSMVLNRGFSKAGSLLFLACASLLVSTLWREAGAALAIHAGTKASEAGGRKIPA